LRSERRERQEQRYVFFKSLKMPTDRSKGDYELRGKGSGAEPDGRLPFCAINHVHEKDEVRSLASQFLEISDGCATVAFAREMGLGAVN
jgi:hypothetical protein